MASSTTGKKTPENPQPFLRELPDVLSHFAETYPQVEVELRCETSGKISAAYERGEALKKRCEELLKQAETRIEKIRLGADGKPAGVAPLDVE